ncbi:hypothetical protein DRN73_05235 [Candidatus Pacearchaeota archaeon]|nr:MAG: hypothetical protein DRN73_05235 [Candidatus Pacearchaeota archaeon]
MRKVLRIIKHYWQRLKRGWSDEDILNLDIFLSRLIADTIRAFRKKSYFFCPPGFKSPEEWKRCLIKIEESFRVAEKVAKGDIVYIPSNEKEKIRKMSKVRGLKVLSIKEAKKFEEGLTLFIKNFHYLWI